MHGVNTPHVKKFTNDMNSPWDESSVVRIVHSTECPWYNTQSVVQTVLGTVCMNSP